MAKRSLLFLVTEDWYFRMHWLPLARAAQSAGFRVVVASNMSDGLADLEAEGFQVIPFDLERRGRTPLALSEVRVLFRLVRLYREMRPDVVQHIAMKPTVYGAFAAWLTRVPAVVNLLAGLGYSFSSEGRHAKIRVFTVAAGLKFLLHRGNSRTVVLNPDDATFLVGGGILRAERMVQVLGSGIDIGRFQALPPPKGERPVVAIAARMLRSKGIDIVVEAVRIARAQGVDLELHIVGIPDEANPDSYSAEELQAWGGEAGIIWRGFVADVRDVWAEADIATLSPRGREGLPVSLLEAAACARPIVTTDSPGCREVVRPGVSGFLVPPGDPTALAEALMRLALDPELRHRFGLAGRELVEGDMAIEKVTGRIVGVYRELSAI